MRKKRRLVMGIEAIEGNPDSLDAEPQCAHCGKTGLKNVFNLIQYGFVVDSVTELWRCRHKECRGYTTFLYAVEVEITEQGIMELEKE